MWPLLVTSIIALTVVLERLCFIWRERRRRAPEVVERILTLVEQSRADDAAKAGAGSEDFVARTLTYALTHRHKSLSNALLRQSNLELQRFNRGLSMLDTAITLAPLLGLLGTVTGMIRTFGLLGGTELGAPAAVTGGIAEALIATACGLGIAILCLLPYNWFNRRLAHFRGGLERTINHVELLVASAKQHGFDLEAFARERALRERARIFRPVEKPATPAPPR